MTETMVPGPLPVALSMWLGNCGHCEGKVLVDGRTTRQNVPLATCQACGLMWTVHLRVAFEPVGGLGQRDVFPAAPPLCAHPGPLKIAAGPNGENRYCPDCGAFLAVREDGNEAEN